MSISISAVGSDMEMGRANGGMGLVAGCWLPYVNKLSTEPGLLCSVMLLLT